jgi:uncharacterized protein (TIGR02145 family)
VILIKVLLTGLVGVSLCMANISGIVTDTGTTPISGAVVQLEKGGQTATTAADGSFTLFVGSTDIHSGNSKKLPNGLSAEISGNIMSVRNAERATVDVVTFDLTGKALSTVRKTLNAGNHSISLPYCGIGIYLHKVKLGNSEFVLKGNSVNGISSGSSVLSQGSSSNHLAKQTKATAAINSVIAVTKEGLLNYRCVIGTSDTSGIGIKMIANAGNVTDVDGNVYQSVRIGNQIWTVENLHVTKFNDGSAIPLDTSKVTWANATTPKYCFYKNTTNSDSLKMYGALYNWYVVNPANIRKIAPTGWHVPTAAEWDTLQNYLFANWDGTITIARSLMAKTNWNTSTTSAENDCDLTKNNTTGFSALPGGFRSNDGGFYSDFGVWWSATEYDALLAWGCDLSCDHGSLRRGSDASKSFGVSVRLVKD